MKNAKKNQIELRLLNIYKNVCRVFELIDNIRTQINEM